MFGSATGHIFHHFNQLFAFTSYISVLFIYYYCTYWYIWIYLAFLYFQTFMWFSLVLFIFIQASSHSFPNVKFELIITLVHVFCILWWRIACIMFYYSTMFQIILLYISAKINPRRKNSKFLQHHSKM